MLYSCYSMAFPLVAYRLIHSPTDAIGAAYSTRGTRTDTHATYE